jgi:FtsH-binding integral membrane protein
VPDERRIGARQVLIVAGVAVALVLGLQLLTYVLPADAQRIVFDSPLLIGVIVVGTIGLLVWIARRQPPEA